MCRFVEELIALHHGKSGHVDVFAVELHFYHFAHFLFGFAVVLFFGVEPFGVFSILGKLVAQLYQPHFFLHHTAAFDDSGHDVFTHLAGNLVGHRTHLQLYEDGVEVCRKGFVVGQDVQSAGDFGVIWQQRAVFA